MSGAVHLVRDPATGEVIGRVVRCPAGDEPCWHATTPDGHMIGRDSTRKDAIAMVQRSRRPVA